MYVFERVCQRAMPVAGVNWCAVPVKSSAGPRLDSESDSTITRRFFKFITAAAGSTPPAVLLLYTGTASGMQY